MTDNSFSSEEGEVKFWRSDMSRKIKPAFVSKNVNTLLFSALKKLIHKMQVKGFRKYY